MHERRDERVTSGAVVAAPSDAKSTEPARPDDRANEKHEFRFVPE